MSYAEKNEVNWQGGEAPLVVGWRETVGNGLHYFLLIFLTKENLLLPYPADTAVPKRFALHPVEEIDQEAWGR